MQENFRLARYEMVLAAGEEGLLLPPYKGSTLRGGFGRAFRHVVCAHRSGQCPSCPIKEDCPYAYIFETAPPPGAAALSNYEAVPRPFVLEPLLEERTCYAPGEELCFQLVLMGRAIDYLPYFAVSFRQLGRIGMGKGKRHFYLRAIRGVNPVSGARTLVYSAAQPLQAPGAHAVSWQQLVEGCLSPAAGRVNRVRLRFMTMTRLKHAGRFVERVDFHVLVRNLLRRVSALAYFHHGFAWREDFAALIRRAMDVQLVRDECRWVDWQRYSARQDSKINLGGVVDLVEYSGELGEFLPLLLLGQHIHVGKACVFGMGQYRLELPEICPAGSEEIAMPGEVCSSYQQANKY
ncbi:MAG: CRISPR system precrRNA processing endoribonuclease RAMP protein Cas6 [Desulfurispora sp.]|uniref:CRISPR system precrRNA processing endoribonuclease RAMP protein Cas6 n=1 Tax=Desulfurispora sp. TaxID=3014275 RepID=UPI00404A3B16